MVALRKQAENQANINLDVDEFKGKPVVSFLGVPLRQVGQLLITEAQVT